MALNIGLRQGRRLCQMSLLDRLRLISDGLPIILESARGFRAASLRLKGNPREADVLLGLADEEAAKILILLDMVRCPQGLAASKVGIIVRWFYDHLARLIYADAVGWKPMNVKQLREYVDRERRAHYLEGHMGEYILPNWNLAKRESQLYADIEAYEDGVPTWNSPTGHDHYFPDFEPMALRLANALSAVGVFSAAGLAATAEIFGQVDFKDLEGRADSERLTEALLERLIVEKLPHEEATDEDVQTIYQTWQLPMYHLDFSLIEIPLDELEGERSAHLWAEVGTPY